jgi:hypothetical protein
LQIKTKIVSCHTPSKPVKQEVNDTKQKMLQNITLIIAILSKMTLVKIKLRKQLSIKPWNIVSGTQHNATRQNDTQKNDNKYNDTKHINPQHNGPKQNDTKQI